MRSKNFMKKMSTTLTVTTLSMLASLLLLGSEAVFAASSPLSFQQVNDDVHALASDQLNGRGNFTAEIDHAADYIAHRFNEIGLKTLNGSYKQSFTVQSIMPAQLDVSINGKKIAEQQLSMATTMADFSWQNVNQVNIHTVGEQDKLRDVLTELNRRGGQHLVLLHPAQEEIFKRYKNYFAHGSNKLTLSHQGTIVLVLTPDTSIAKLSAQGKAIITEQRLTNVVGLLPGKKQAQEKLLFSAHYDHLGVKTVASASEESADLIFNGADDDASGTTAVINLASYFANQNRNERTLMFVAFAGEEIGGFGSRYFSQQLNPEQLVAMINIEMIGKPSKFGEGSLWMTGSERSDLNAIMNQTLKAYERQIHVDPYPEQDLFYRSDNATLARLGVPAHSFSSTQLDKDQHYHQVSDNISSLNVPSMYQVIETLAFASQDLVNGTVTPSRIDKTNVRNEGLIF